MSNPGPARFYRKVYTAEGYFIHPGGQRNHMESHSFTTSPWGSLMKESVLSVTVTGSVGVIDSVSANNVMMVGAA